jgi:hypothetical protein
VAAASGASLSLGMGPTVVSVAFALVAQPACKRVVFGHPSAR